MFRLLFAFAAFALFLTPVVADPKKPTFELSGSIADESLENELPPQRVIVSEKAWEKLAKAWGIKNPPKVDFTKELLVVGTWNGSMFDLTAEVSKKGDLDIETFGTQDLAKGFRWKVQSISREGIKTVRGKELPKE